MDSIKIAVTGKGLTYLQNLFHFWHGQSQNIYFFLKPNASAVQLKKVEVMAAITQLKSYPFLNYDMIEETVFESVRIQ